MAIVEQREDGTFVPLSDAEFFRSAEWQQVARRFIPDTPDVFEFFPGLADVLDELAESIAGTSRPGRRVARRLLLQDFRRLAGLRAADRQRVLHARVSGGEDRAEEALQLALRAAAALRELVSRREEVRGRVQCVVAARRAARQPRTLASRPVQRRTALLRTCRSARTASLPDPVPAGLSVDRRSRVARGPRPSVLVV